MLQSNFLLKEKSSKNGFRTNTSIQPKLKMGQFGDKYKKDADALADRVMMMSEPNPIQMQPEEEEEEMVQMKPDLANAEKIQMKCKEGEEEEMLQPKTENKTKVASADISDQLLSNSGTGSSMPENTNRFMSNSFGADFSRVKIHTGSQAVQMNEQLGARAFTHGNDIYFNSGEYNPVSSDGKSLLAHELTHVVQQTGSKVIQRTCDDGVCEDCEGGMKTLWVTVFFRRRATAETMRILRQKINEAKKILKTCCINLYFDFNWTLLSGNRDFDPGTARPAGSAEGAWDYPEDAETLGEGTTFSGARGVPMLIVDSVPRTGGGVTISDDFDTDYDASSYIVIPINHGKIRAIAHELGHVAGILSHTPGPNVMDSAESTNVYPEYCTAMRDMAS